MDKSYDYNHHEDAYFRQEEARLRDQLRQKMKTAASGADPAPGQTLTDEQLRSRLEELGVDEDQASVLHLVPLVEVAWADGQVQLRERQAIFEAAAQHGATPGTPAAAYLAALLETKPDADYLRQIHSLLTTLLAKRGLQADSLTAMSTNVAKAAGGFFGLSNAVDDRERQVIQQLSQSLGSKGG